MSVDLQTYKGTEGQVAWYSAWTGLIDAIQAGINANANGINALDSIANGGYGLMAGAVHTSVLPPSDEHVELAYPAGTDFRIDNYPALYANVSASLTDFTAIASGTVADLYGLIYQDSRILAAGVQKGIYSLDGGLTWNSASVSPAKTVRAVAGNGLTGASSIVVGVGNADYIGTTSGIAAGDTWTTQTSPILDTNWNWSDVKWFAGTVNAFCALALTEVTPGVYSSKIYTSADGVTWTLQKTIAGRFESIAYNNNAGSTDVFMIVGWGSFGSTNSAQKATALNGTWTNVTVGGTADQYLFNSVQYYTGSGIFTIGGAVGVLGYMNAGASDITRLDDLTGTPLINRIVNDQEEETAIALTDTVGGLARIYRVNNTGWIPEGVGSFALHDYINTGSERVIVGNGGTIFRTTAAAPGDFTMPYPATVALNSPYKYWILTQNVTTTAGGETVVGQGDLANLKTGWFYVRLEDSGRYVRGIRRRDSDNLLVAFGDEGLLFTSDDYGSTWVDRGSSLGLIEDIADVALSDAYQTVLYSATFKTSVDDFATITYTNTYGEGLTPKPAFISAAIDSGRLIAFLNDGRGLNQLPTNTSSWTASFISADNNDSFTDRMKIVFLSAYAYFPVYNSTDKDSYIARWTKDGGAPYADTESTSIPDFMVYQSNYSNLYNEFLIVGASGSAYRFSSDLSAYSEITTGISFDIEDCAFISGAWVMLTRRGCLYTTDSATVTNLTASDESITTKPAGNSLISIPTQFRLVANDLGLPGYVRVCQL